MDGGSKKQWLNELQQHRTPDIRRPMWLWSSVVDLLINHERISGA